MAPTRSWYYRFAQQRNYLDAYVIRPFVALFRACDALERRWADFL
jgi:NAD(P)H-quinone oxidoreductase subunit 5